MLQTGVAETWQHVRAEPCYQELTRVPWTLYLLEDSLPQLSKQFQKPERHELFEEAVRSWLRRFGMQQQDIEKGLIQLERFAASWVTGDHVDVNDDYRKAGILIRPPWGGYGFKHYSLLEYFFARALRREFIAYRSDLLSRVNLLYAYGINRFSCRCFSPMKRLIEPR